MTQTETLYSAKQVAAELKISSGMLRRYALAFEEITSQKINQHPRDGRQYSADQLATLQRAKAFVTSNPGMSVDSALRLAMGASEAEVARSPSLDKGMDTEALTSALEIVVSPLLDEIKALRLSNERLSAALERQPSQEKREVSLETSGRDSTSGDAPNQTQDGILVKWARRVESWLGRGSQ